MPILIINDKDDERSGMRSEMRDSMSMRSGSGMRHYPMHYKEGQMREDYRRQRDRMGRYK